MHCSPFWGRGAVTSFEGREGDLNLDGEVTTWMVGTDWSWGQWQGSEARRHYCRAASLAHHRRWQL